MNKLAVIFSRLQTLFHMIDMNWKSLSEMIELDKSWSQ